MSTTGQSFRVVLCGGSVRARGLVAEWNSGSNVGAGPFPFPFWRWEAFPFPLWDYSEFK